MRTLSDEVAVRFTGLHPGFSLVDYQDVGLPFFELRLDVMAQKRDPLPVIDEYVLRLAELGLRSTDQISGFLGLEQPLVRESVLSLLQNDLVDYAPSHEGRQIKLTTLGTSVLNERLQQVPQRTELRIGFDRLLWKLSARWMRSWENPKTFKDTGNLQIAVKLKRRPDAAEIDAATLNTVLKELPTTRREETDLDVLQVLNVSTSTKYLPALMLVFVSDDQSAIRASFIVDAHHSPEHDQAFADIDGLNRLGIRLADPQSINQDRPVLSDELESLRPAPDQVEELIKRYNRTATALHTAVAKAEVAEVAESVSRHDQSTREQLADREREVEALRQELESLQAERDSLPLRPISTYEHRMLLEDALDRTQKRLLLISPWVRANVVDQDFATSLERLAKAGVAIHIGYGIGAEDRQGHHKSALDKLQKLALRYRNVTFKELNYTHAKVLIWDDSLVVTSFNWLSFKGDRGREYRQEEGTLIQVGKYVDREYLRYKANIESSKPPTGTTGLAPLS